MGFNTQKQVSNSIQPAPEPIVPKPTDTPTDYFTLKTSGLSDQDIKDHLEQSGKYPLILPKEKAAQIVQKQFTGADGKFDQPGFDKYYDDVHSQFTLFNHGLYDSTQRTLGNFGPETKSVLSSYRKGLDPNAQKISTSQTENDDRFITNGWGKYEQVKTDGQSAAEKNFFMMDGKKKTLGTDYDDIAKSAWREGYKLNIEDDPNGGVMYVARKLDDPKVKWNHILTSQGPQQMEEGFWTGLWNNAVNYGYKIPSLIGSALEETDKLVKFANPDPKSMMMPGWDALATTEPSDPLNKFAQSLQNYSDITVHPDTFKGESGEREWGAFVGHALGFVGQAWIGGGVGKLFGAGQAGSTITMAMGMADSYHQSAKAAGVTGLKELGGYATSFLGSMALMGSTSKMMSGLLGVDQAAFSNAYMKGEFNKIAQESIQKNAMDMFGKTAAELTKEESELLGKSVTKDIFGYAMALPKAGANLLKAGMKSSVPLIAHPLSTGVEISLFTVLDNTIKTFQDYTADKDATVGNGLFKDTKPGVEDFFSRMFENTGESFKDGLMIGMAGALIPKVVSKFAGVKTREDTQRMTKQDLIVKGLDGNLTESVKGMYDAKTLGQDFINAQTGELIKPGEIDPNTNQRPKSLNDLAWDNFQKDLTTEKQAFIDSGLKKWRDEYVANPKMKDKSDAINKITADYLKEIMDPNKIASEGLDLLYKKREANRILREEGSSEKQKQEAMTQIQESDTKLEKIKSGEYANELLRHGLVKAEQMQTMLMGPMEPGASQKQFSPLALQSAIENGSFVTGKQVDDINKSIDTAITTGASEQQRVQTESGLMNDKTIPDILSSIPVSEGIDPEVSAKVNAILGQAKGLSITEKSKTSLSEGLRNHIDANVKVLMDKLGVTKDIEVEDIDQVHNKVNSMPDSPEKAQYLRDLRQLDDLIASHGNVSTLGEISAEANNAKQQAYLSENTGTSDAPIFKSFESTLADFQNSNLNSSADFLRLQDLLKNIKRNAKALEINGTTLNKLDDKISGLNENNKILASDLDFNDKNSIAYKLQELEGKANQIINGSASMSEFARRYNEANFKHNDIAIRSAFNAVIFSGVENIAKHGLAKDIAESSSLQKQYIASYEEFLKAKSLSKAEHELKFSELEKLQNTIVTKNLVIEGKLHNWINSNTKTAQELFDNVISKGGAFYYTQDTLGKIPGVLGDTNAFAFNLDQDASGKVSYNSMHYLGSKSLNKAMQFNLFVNHFNTIKRLSSSEFYSALDKVVNVQKEKAGDNYKAPSYEQRESLRHVAGFLVDSSSLYSGSEAVDFYSKFNSNELYVQGYAGTGKTSEVVGNALSVLEQIRKGRDENADPTKLLILAPSTPQVRTLKESIDKFVSVSIKRQHSTTNDYIKGAATNASADLIVIDEASELSKSDLISIRERAKNGKSKLLWLGDSSQIPSDLKQALPDVAFGTEKTNPLTEVFRSGVYDISRIQQQFRDVAIDMIEKPAILLPTQYTVDVDGHAVTGVLLRDSSPNSTIDQVDAFVKDIKNPNIAQKTVFIVTTDEKRIELIGQIATKYNLNPAVLESKVKTILAGDNTFKGLQSDRVYANLDKESLGNNYNKGQLTASSRAISFLDIMTDKPKSSLASSTKVESLTDNTDAYKAEEASRIKKYADDQTMLISDQAKTLSNEVPASKNDQKSDEFVFDKETEKEENSQEKETKKIEDKDPAKEKSPIEKKSRKKPEELDSVKHGNSIIKSGTQVVDKNGNIVRIDKITQSGNKVTLIVNGKRMGIGSFASNYSVFEFNKVSDISNSESSIDSKGKIQKSSIERSKNGQHTFMSAVSMFAEHSAPDKLHREIKSDILQDIYRNKPSGLIKKYYKALTYFDYAKGKEVVANHAVTVELNTTDPKVVQYLKDKGVKDNELDKMKIIAILPEGPGKNMSFSELSSLSSKTDDQILDHLNVKVSDKITPDEFEYEKAKFSDRMTAIRNMNSSDTEYNLGPANTKGASAGRVEYAPGNYRPLSDLLNDKRFSNVHFQKPVFIFDPLEEGFDPNSPSTIKQNGEFEPGYYLIYSHDKSFSNPGMVKLRSANITNRASVSEVIRNFIKKPIKSAGPSFYSNEGGYYDHINKFLSSNRYFFGEKVNNSWSVRSEFKGLVSIDTRKAKDGKIYTNFKVNILDGSGNPTPERVRQDRLNKLADKIESSTIKDGDKEIGLHDMALISPGNNELVNFENDKDKLETNVTNIYQPTIYVDRLNKPTNIENDFTPKNISEQGYDSEDVLASIEKDEPVDWKNRLQEKFATENLSQDEAMDKSGISDEMTMDVEPSGKSLKSSSRDQKARDYYSLSGIFHNANKVATIRKVVASRIINASIVGRDLSSLKSLNESREDVFNQYKQEREKLLASGKTYTVIRDGNNVNVRITDLDRNDLALLKGTALTDYVNFNLGRTDVFDKFVKNIFPNTIIGDVGEVKPSIFSVDEDGTLSYNIGDEQALGGETTIQTGKQFQNPLRGASDAVKLVMNSVHYNEYTFDASGNRVVVPAKQPVNIPAMLMHKLLVNASNASRYERTADQENMAASQLFADNLLKNAHAGVVFDDNGTKTPTKISNIIYSIHDALFHRPEGKFSDALSDLKKDGRYSYSALANDMEHIAKTEGLDKTTATEKSKQAANILSSVYNFYYSLTSSSYDKASMDTVTNDLRYITSQAKEWADISGKIKQSILQGMYEGSEGALKLRDGKKKLLFDTFDTEYIAPAKGENHYSRGDLTQVEINKIVSDWREIDPSKKESEIIQNKRPNKVDGYRYTANGIYSVKDGVQTKIISRSGDKFTAEKGFNVQTARDIFKVFGLGQSHISNATLNAFFNEGASASEIRERQVAYKDITGSDISDGGVTKDKLMKTINNFMRSIVSPETEDMDNPSVMTSEDRSAFLENIGETSNMNSPTAHWPLIKDLSIVESYNRGNDYLRFAYTADGRKIWLDTNSTQLRDLLGYSTNDVHAGRGMADQFTKNLASGLIMHSPSIATDGSILNPLLDPNGDRKVISMRNIGAVEKGNRAKSYPQLSGKEWYSLNTEAGFIDSIVAHKDNKGNYNVRKSGLRYRMPMMNMGIYGDLVTIEYEARKGSEPVIVREGRSATNWGHFTNSFIRMFEIQKNRQRVSHEKMTRFIEDHVTSGKFPLDSQAYKNYLDSKELYLDNPEQLEAFIQEHIVKHASYKDFLDSLRKSHDLHNNRDYKIDGNTLALGNDAMMEFVDKAGNNFNDIFSSKNHKQLHEVLNLNDPKLAANYLRSLVGNRLDAYIYDMYKEGVSPSERSIELFPDAQKGQGYFVDAEAPLDASWQNTEGYVMKGAKGVRVRKYNPFYEGFYLSYLEHSFNLGDVTLGAPGQFKSMVDMSKYGYNLNTPKSSFDLSNPNGLSEKSLYIAITDDVLHDPTLGKSVTATDGWGIQVSAHSWLEHNSSGGEYGNVKQAIGPKKQIFTHTQTVDGSRELIKNSWQDTAALRKMSKKYADLEKRMLSYKQLPEGGTLYDKLVEFGFDDQKLAQYIADNKLHEYYIAKAFPLSSMKGAQFGIHDASRLMDPSYELNPIQVENKYNGTVLDPNKDAKEDSASMLNQLMAQMQIGSHNSPRTKEIMKSLAKIVDRNMTNIQRDFAKAGGFQDWIKGIGIEAGQSMPSVGNFIEYLNSLDASVQPQPIDDRLRTVFLSKLNNDGLRTRFTSGGSYVQNPGHGIDVYRAAADVPEWGIKSGKSVLVGDAFNKKISQYPAFPANAFSIDPEGLGFVKISDKVSPGEVVMGFKDFHKFGFNDNGPQDGLDYRNFTLDEMMCFKSGDKCIRYDNLGDTPEERMAAAKTIMDATGLGSDTIALMALHNKEVEGGATIEKGLESAANYGKLFQWYENLMDHNKILASRIPSSKTASGNVYDVIEYNNDASNTIFTSPKKNILDDSDYDIDELRIYTKETDNNGNPITSDSMEGDKNNILSHAMDYYADIKNAESFMSPVSTESIEALLDQRDLAENSDRGNTELLDDVRTNKNIWTKTMMGSETMGIFVNSIKSYSQLFAAYQAESGNHFNIDLFGQKFNKFSTHGMSNESIIDVLASVLQSALDNPKKVLLGRMFGNTVTADAIAGMAIIGVPKEKIIDFISGDTTREVLGDVLFSKNLDTPTRSVSQTINSWEQAYKTIDSEIGNIIGNTKLSPKQKAEEINLIRNKFKSLARVDITGHRVTESVTGADMSSDITTDDMTFSNKPTLIENIEQTYDFTPIIDTVAKKLSDIAELRKAMLIGQGISRMGKLLSFTQGIKSNQWDIYRLNRDVNHILGGSKDYLEQRETTPIIRGKKVDWADKQMSDLETHTNDEGYINSFIDFNKVVDESDNMQAYLKTLDFYNRQVKDNFIADHPVLNSLVSSKLEGIRIQDLQFENQFKSVKAAKWKTLSSLYLQDAFSKDSGKNFSLRQDTNGAFMGEEYISIPAGQAHFIAQLPLLIKDIKENPSKYNPNDPKAIENNYFLKKLAVNVLGNGDHALSLTDDFYYTDTEKSALKSFADQLGKDTGIPNIVEMLFAHNLIKNGLRTYRGDFTEYLDKSHMVDFGNYLQQKHDILNGDQNSSEFVELTGRLHDTMQPFEVNSTDLIPMIPNKSSDFKDDYLPELKMENKAGGKNPETGRLIANTANGLKLVDYPDYVKAFTKREGSNSSALHTLKLDRETGIYSIVENKYSDLVNNWVNDGVTSNKTFHKLPMYMADQLNRDASKVIRIPVNKGNFYAKGLYYLKDGSVAQVQMSGRNEVIVTRVPEKSLASIDDEFVNDMNSRQEDYNFEQYQNAPTKRAGLESVIKHSLILPNRYLAEALLKSASGKYIDTGMLKWATKDTDINLYSDEKAAALFGTKTKNVTINKDKVVDASGFERRFLHEMLHNHTAEIINKTAENRSFAEQKFVEDLSAVFEHVKSNLGDIQSEVYGMKNLHEFVAEGFTNRNFQLILDGIDAHPGIKSPAIPTAWRQFVDAIKSLFNLTGYKRITASSLDQVLGLSTDIMESGKTENTDMVEDVLAAKDDEKKYSFTGPAKDVKDIGEIVTGINLKEHRFDNVNALMGRMYEVMSENYARSGNKYTYFANGKDYVVENIKDDAELRSVARDIISDQNNYEVELRDQVLRTALTGDVSHLGKAIKDNADMITNIVQVPEGGKIMPYSDLKIEHPELHNDIFKDYEPLVKVEKDGDKLRVSIVDITGKPLFAKIGRDRKGYISDNVIKQDPNILDDQHLRLFKDELGVRKFNMLLAYMDIKSRNPNVIIEGGMVANVTGAGMIQGVYAPDYIAEMKTILRSKGTYENLPDSIKTIVDDVSIDKPDVFSENYFGSMLNGYRQRMNMYERMQEEATSETDKSKATSNFLTQNHFFNKLNQYNQGHEIFKQDVKNIIESRMMDITNKYKGNLEMTNLDQEMIELTKALMFIDKKGTGLNEAKWGIDMKAMGKYVKGNYSLAHPVAQWFRFRTMKALDTVMNQYIDGFKKNFNNALEPLNEVYSKSASFDIVTERIKDIGFKRFERLYIRDKVLDKFNKLHDVNTYEIHFSYKDESGKTIMHQKTADALKNKAITQSEVDFGGFVVKSIKDAFIKNRMATGDSYDVAKHYYDTNWKDGRIPILQSRASEKIFTKNWKQGLDQWIQRYSNSNELYEYMSQKTDNSPHKIAQMFSYQMDANPFGSKERENMIGLQFDNNAGQNQRRVSGEDDKQITDALRQNETGVEKNLELVMNYLMMNHFSKMELDKVLPIYNGTIAVLNAFETSKGEKLSNTMDYVKEMTSFIIKGERKGGDDRITIPNPLGKDLTLSFSNLTNNLTSLTAVSVLHGNIFADMKNFGVNGLNTASFATANSAAGGKFFGTKEWLEAINVWNTDWKMAAKLTDDYRMASMDRGSVINSQRFSKTKEQWVNSFHLTYGQFAGDWMHRGLALIAQLKKDGAFEAHSLDKDDNLTYDVKKDKRYYSNGKLTENGKVLLEEKKIQLEQEGVPLKNGMPAKAYDSRERQSVKAITDKYILGGYDEQSKRNMEAWAALKMITTMKRFLLDKAEVLYATPYRNDVLGGYEVQDVDVNGVKQKQAVWVGTDLEGVFQSVLGTIADAKKISEMGVSEYWNQASTNRKMNIVQTAQNIATVCVMLAVAPVVLGVDDKELNSRHADFMKTKMYKTMMYTFNDLISGNNPNTYWSALNNPFFAITQIGHLAEFAEAVLTLNTRSMKTTASKTFGFVRTGQAIESLFEGPAKKEKKSHHKQEVIK